DLDKISPLSGGNDADGLPQGLDEIGQIPGKSGLQDPVRMERLADGDHTRWVFTATTVENIDTWFERLPDRWAIEHLPQQLLQPAPMELLWWQWLALPIVALLGWIIGAVLGTLTRAILGRLVKRTEVTWDDLLLLKIAGPLTLAWTIGAISALVPWLGLYTPAEGFIHGVLTAGLVRRAVLAAAPAGGGARGRAWGGAGCAPPRRARPLL